MSNLLRFAIVLTVSVCQVFGASGKPQTAPVLGQIVESSGATVDGVPALGSGTLLAGDTLATPPGGGALIRIPGNGQVELSENTTVGFSGTPGHVVAKVAQGSVVAQEPDQESLVVEAAQCRIRPAEAQSAAFSVSAPLSGAATITARTGSISVIGIRSAQARTLGQGETFVCPNVSEAAPGQAREESKPAPPERAGQAPPVEAPKHSNTALIVLLLGGGAAAGIGAAVAAGGHGGGGGGPASPSAP